MGDIPSLFLPRDGDVVVIAICDENFIIYRANAIGMTKPIVSMAQTSRETAVRAARDFVRHDRRVLFFRTPEGDYERVFVRPSQKD